MDGRGPAIGLALRRGRQYPRETSIHGSPYALPGSGDIVAWSRILFQQEVLVVINTHGETSRSARVTVDRTMPRARPEMTVRYRSDWSDSELSQPPQGQTIAIQTDPNDGRSVVQIDLPPSGMMIVA